MGVSGRYHFKIHSDIFLCTVKQEGPLKLFLCSTIFCIFLFRSTELSKTDFGGPEDSMLDDDLDDLLGSFSDDDMAVDRNISKNDDELLLEMDELLA